VNVAIKEKNHGFEKKCGEKWGIVVGNDYLCRRR
jgi:hypothetical protein